MDDYDMRYARATGRLLANLQHAVTVIKIAADHSEDSVTVEFLRENQVNLQAALDRVEADLRAPVATEHMKEAA